MKSIELVSYSATAAAVVGTAAAALAGDSLTIKNANKGKKCDILAWWSTNNTNVGFHQLTFPSAHDTTRNARVGTFAGPQGVNPSLLSFGRSVPIVPQELLSLVIGANAVAGDVENGTMLIRYEDMPGQSQRLLTPAQLESQALLYPTIEQAIVSAAGPGYSGTALITATTDLLRANTDYAVLGFTCRTPVHLIGITGPDTSNLRVGCPGVQRPELTSQWFVALSRLHGEGLIPVINSGNRNSTSFFVATDENAGTFTITAHLAMLK